MIPFEEEQKVPPNRYPYPTCCSWHQSFTVIEKRKENLEPFYSFSKDISWECGKHQGGSGASLFFSAPTASPLHADDLGILPSTGPFCLDASPQKQTGCVL